MDVYSNEILRTLHSFQQDEYLCDVILVAEDGNVRAHSTVLAAASSVFKASLNHDRKTAEYVIVLPGIKLEVLEVAVNLAYTGVINMPPSFSTAGVKAVIKTLAELGMKLPTVSTDRIEHEEYPLAQACNLKLDKKVFLNTISKSKQSPLTVPVAISLPPNHLPTKRSSQESDDTVEGQPQAAMLADPANVEEGNEHADSSSRVVSLVIPSCCKEQPPTIDPSLRGPQLCELCGYLSNSKPMHDTHMARHSGVKRFLCSICGASFVTMYEVKAHMTRVHVGDTVRRHACPYCQRQNVDKCYADIASLREHCYVHHNVNPNDSCWGPVRPAKKCPHCERLFIDKHRMDQHVRAHTGERPFICPVCSRRFIARQQLRWHMHQHTGEKPYLCHDCGTSFSQPSGYYGHMKSVHKKSKCSLSAAQRMNTS